MHILAKRRSSISLSLLFIFCSVSWTSYAEDNETQQNQPEYSEALRDDEAMRKAANQLRLEAIAKVESDLAEAEADGLTHITKRIKDSLLNGSYTYVKEGEHTKVSLLESQGYYFASVELDYDQFPRSKNIGFFIYSHSMDSFTDSQKNKILKFLGQKKNDTDPEFGFSDEFINKIAQTQSMSVSDLKIKLAKFNPKLRVFLSKLEYSMNIQILNIDDDTGEIIDSNYREKPSMLSLLKKAKLFAQKTYEKPTFENFLLGLICGTLQGVISAYISFNSPQQMNSFFSPEMVPVASGMWSLIFGGSMGLFGNTMANYIYEGSFFMRTLKSGMFSILFLVVLGAIQDPAEFFSAYGLKLMSANFFLNLYGKDVAIYAIPRFRKILGWSKGHQIANEMQSFYHIFFMPKIAHVVNDNFEAGDYWSYLKMGILMSFSYQKSHHLNYKAKANNQMYLSDQISDQKDSLLKRIISSYNKTEHKIIATLFKVDPDYKPTKEDKRMFQAISKQLDDFYSALNLGLVYGKNSLLKKLMNLGMDRRINHIQANLDNLDEKTVDRYRAFLKPQGCHSQFSYTGLNQGH